MLRQAVALSDVRTESACETILREFHRIAEAPVAPQHHVHDDHGNWLARGDLWFPGTKVSHDLVRRAAGVLRDVDLVLLHALGTRVAT